MLTYCLFSLFVKLYRNYNFLVTEVANRGKVTETDVMIQFLREFSSDCNTSTKSKTVSKVKWQFMFCN